MTLQAYQLGFSRDGHGLFRDINFEIGAGEAMWLTGSNGSGKTSLLRLLCGLSAPLDGEVRWGGRGIQMLREEFFRELIYCGHASGVQDDLAAWENLAFAVALSGKDCGRGDACHALEQVGLGGVAHLPVRVLSQGQRKRVALARLCLDPLPKLVVLDEPFTALDQAALAGVCAILNRHLSKGGIVVYTTHQEVTLTAGRLHLLDLSRTGSC